MNRPPLLGTLQKYGLSFVSDSIGPLSIYVIGGNWFDRHQGGWKVRGKPKVIDNYYIGPHCFDLKNEVDEEREESK